MTVLEYFDYEKQLLEDFRSVKTDGAKLAIFNEICGVLDSHKQFVINTMRDFEKRIDENAKQLNQAYRGETPDYVKKLMAEFGFYELEETDNVGDWEKPISVERMKDLCSDGDGDIIEDFKKSRSRGGLSDEEADAQNAKIMSAARPDSNNFDIDLTTMTADAFFKDSGESSSQSCRQAAKRGKTDRRAKKGQKKITAKKPAVAKPEGKQ